VNLFGLLAMTRTALPLLRQAKGRIVNIGSISGRAPVPFVASYSASKAGVWAVSEALRVELRPWGMDVVLIEPGSISTPIWEKGVADFQERQAQLSQAALDLYGRLLPRMLAITERTARGGIPADRVAGRVEQALTARRPKTRYLVGIDARVQALLRHLPDRARDALIARYVGL
jgi:NAD(P)-dependent dehydrogenase (short-subunit alcohol dehydrogenase family)